MEKHSDPCTLCSFGKDSTVMLDLIRKVQKVPVVHFRMPGQDRKYEFGDKLCAQWGIETISFPPLIVDLISKNKQVDLLQVIPVGDILLFLQSELYRPVAGNCVCSLQMIPGHLDKPQKTQYDLIFNGHRGDDVDPLWGKVSLIKDRFIHKNTTMFYPLKDWTQQDIWDYVEKHNVPYNDKRYCKDYKYKEFEDKTYNENYHFACTECVNPSNPEVVFCPIVNRMVPNISDRMNYKEKEVICKNIIKNVKPEV